VADRLRVTRLSTTPVKGLALHHPESIELTEHGVPGDREFYLVDHTGRVQSCTHNRTLYGLTATFADEVLEVRRGDEVLRRGGVERGRAVETDLYGLHLVEATEVVDPGWSALFSEVIGKDVTFLRARNQAYDVEPATLLGAASVAELERRAGIDAVDPRRFRMLVDFAGGDPHVEDTWDGRLVRVGEALLRGGGPVQRCAATTRDPETGAIDLQTLRLITGYRARQDSVYGLGANFGVYARVVEPGTVRVGDDISLVRS
jgi:uncharacterized protein YcbX